MSRSFEPVDNTDEDQALNKLYGDVALRQHLVNTAMFPDDDTGRTWISRATADRQHVDRGHEMDPVTHTVTKVYISFLNAALDEAFELFRSVVVFKWWGDPAANKVDMYNAVVECVDILHFLISEHIRVYCAGLKEVDEPRVRQAGVQFCHEFVTAFTESDSLDFAHNGSMQLTGSVKELIAAIPSKLNMRETVRAFSRVCYCLGLTPEKLGNLYFAKATLNEFRTSKFKQARLTNSEPYKKVWSDGREDNAHLFGWFNQVVNDEKRFPGTVEIRDFLERNHAAQH